MLKKKQRLSRSEFASLLQKGKRIHTPHFSFVYIFAEKTKCGLVVSKKTAKKATERNLLRRRIYSVFGENFPFLQNVHCALLTRPSISTLSYLELKNNIKKTLTSIKNNGKTVSSKVE